MKTHLLPTPAVNLAADERIPGVPPVIAPVGSRVRRPRWSVMMPTYNCLAYLRDALESVLAQDPGPEHMQVMVVDDCSTDGDVRALVQAVGHGRIDYFQQPRNVGSLRNFETCLNRSTGHWVHLLHGDDRVLPGFYAEIEALFERYPEAGAAFTNVAHIFVGKPGAYVNEPLAAEPGILPDFVAQIAQRQLVQPPAIVVKRSVYEQVGSFFAAHYGEDWEMWARIAARFPFAYSPRCLAHYRYLTSNSITHRSVRSGQNVRDILKITNIIQDYLPADRRKELGRIARRDYAIYCASLAHAFYEEGDLPAALIQMKGALTLSKDIRVVRLALKFYVKDAIHYQKLRKLLQPAVAAG